MARCRPDLQDPMTPPRPEDAKRETEALKEGADLPSVARGTGPGEGRLLQHHRLFEGRRRGGAARPDSSR